MRRLFFPAKEWPLFNRMYRRGTRYFNRTDTIFDGFKVNVKIILCVTCASLALAQYGAHLISFATLSLCD